MKSFMLLARARLHAVIKNTWPHLALLLLFALEARWAQQLTEAEFINNLLFIDLICAATLVLLPSVMVYLAAGVQFCSGLFIYSYVTALQIRPQMSAILNGFDAFTAMRGNMLDYVSLPVAGLLLAALLAKVLLARRRKKAPARVKYSLWLICLILLGVQAHKAISHKRVGRFVSEQGFSNIDAHFKRYGYLFTWGVELATGRPFESRQIYREQTCRDEATQNLPLFPIWDKIVFIQTESLDFELLGLKEDTATVAPFLTALAQKSLVLHMDGTKIMASANSDYELLNGRIASQNVIYYSYIATYPDSLISLLRGKGYEASVFHGLRGEYMGLRDVYPRLGFNHLFFAEELIKAGLSGQPDMFMDQVPDADLFKFALQRATGPGPFVHFIITITMHGGNPPMSGRFPEAGYAGDCAYYDEALAGYINNLPEDCTVFIYGDHQSYNGANRNMTVPFIIYQKGRDLSALQSQIPAQTIFSRCEISNYLRRLFTMDQP